MDAVLWAQSVVNGLMCAGIYILVALGLALVLSIMGIVNLAHGELYMLGGYLVYYFSSRVGLNFFLALVISILIVGLFGIFMERFFFRRFRRGEFFGAVIISIGFMLLLQASAVIIFGSSVVRVASPISGTINIAGVMLSWERLTIILVSLFFVLGLIYITNKAKVGLAMVAVSQNLDAAALQGINPDHVSSVAMFIGSCLAAAAGALMGAAFSLNPFMGGPALMKGTAVIILGGVGSITATVVGGLILGLIDGIIPPLLNSQMASLLCFVVIVLVLLFKPQGIMGRGS